MADKIAVNSVTNCNVYLDGVNLLGRAMEVTLPTPTQVMIEHKGLGMAHQVEIPTGAFERMEATIKWSSFYPEVLAGTSNPRKTVQLQVRASVERFTGQGLAEESSLIVTLGGIWKSPPFGLAFMQHEAVQPDSTLTVYYMRIEADGQVLYEIDVLNNIHTAGGTDILGTIRRIIGG